jgi:hypothetical protein
LAAPLEYFDLKDLSTSADGVCMSDTNRYIGHRRPPLSAPHASVETGLLVNAPSRVEALRKLIAAGQYQVNPRWLATKIFSAAGLTIPG